MEENKKKEYEARAQRCKIKADDILIDDFASTLIRDYNLPASLKGISDAITKWAFEFSDIPFIEYWEKFLHDEIKERWFAFPLLNVQMTDLKIWQISEDIKVKNIHYKEVCSGILEKTNFLGHEYAAFIVTRSFGEFLYARQQAFELSESVVDFIKFCDRCGDYKGKLKKNIGIDQQLINRKIMMVLHGESDHKLTNIQLSTDERTLEFNSKYVQQIKDAGFDDLCSILQYKPKTQNELEKHVIRAIKNYSCALTVKSDYECIVKLCSILDSIVLEENTRSPITEAALRYVPILCSTDKEERLRIRKELSFMYKARGEYMHHCVEQKEKINVVYLLSVVKLFITKFYEQRHNFETKKELFNAIDDALIGVTFGSEHVN